MTCFYQASDMLQTILIVISQFVIISHTVGIVLLFKRKSRSAKIIGIATMLLINVILYVFMQLDSRMTETGQGLHLHIPYVILMIITLLSLVFGIILILGETKNRKTINNTSIKESFDNLPTGVCFFNEMGLPVLCNHAMRRFSFDVCGKDIQFVNDIENCFKEDFKPVNDVQKQGLVFVLKDGTAINLERRSFIHKRGNCYTQYISTDVTELYKKRTELQDENAKLRRVQSDLKVLSANVVAITREEEILNTKMRVHDEMGRCLVEARKYLSEDCIENIPDTVISAWQRAVSMLKYNNENTDENMLSQIRKTCKNINLDFIQTGELPKEESIAYILTCAVRECLTNAVRYAESTKLYADFVENEKEATVIVHNNGKQPCGEIVEGGGLSTLRQRVERAGGTMIIQSMPEFKLTVSIPKENEVVLC